MEITLTGIEKAIAALERITKMGFRPSFDRFYQEYLRRTFRSRFLTAAEQTPYAPGSLGTRKSVSRVVRGGADDPGFGIDSRTLLKEVSGETQGGVQISDTVLDLMSVTPYAPFVYEKFKAKGPFAPGGIFDLEESDIEPLFDLVAQQIEQGWLRD